MKSAIIKKFLYQYLPSILDFDTSNSRDVWPQDEGGGRGAAVAKAFKRAVADYEIEMKIKVITLHSHLIGKGE
jgi:hypothetical protein